MSTKPKQSFVYLLSLPFHCLKRSLLATSGSSLNHSSLERGGLMYGKWFSSPITKTWVCCMVFSRKLDKRGHITHRKTSYLGFRISRLYGTKCSKWRCPSSNQQVRNVNRQFQSACFDWSYPTCQEKTWEITLWDLDQLFSLLTKLYFNFIQFYN